jgi:hypothetical protein
MSDTPSEYSSGSSGEYESDVEDIAPVLYDLFQNADGINVVEALLALKTSVDTCVNLIKNSALPKPAAD